MNFHKRAKVESIIVLTAIFSGCSGVPAPTEGIMLPDVPAVVQETINAAEASDFYWSRTIRPNGEVSVYHATILIQPDGDLDWEDIGEFRRRNAEDFD
jgi:hypothetical protein